MGLADDELARQVLGDAWFVAPARWLAARTSAGAPSYLYHFDYVAAARRDRAKGAGHGSEIPYIFGTLGYFASLAGPVDDEDRRFGEGVSACWVAFAKNGVPRSEEHTSELQSLMRTSYAVFCLKKNKKE